MVEEDVEIGGDDADKDDDTFVRFDKGDELGGEAVEGKDFGEGGSEEKGEEGSEDGGFGDAKDAMRAAAGGAEVKQEREGGDKDDVDESVD